MEFLKALRAQLKRKLLIVWDGAAQHKSRIVRGYLDSTKGALQMALLPGYSPDLNPVEYLWACSSGTPWPTSAHARWPSSRPLRAAGCAAASAASPSSLRAGSRPSCGDVMNYVKLNNEIWSMELC